MKIRLQKINRWGGGGVTEIECALADVESELATRRGTGWRVDVDTDPVVGGGGDAVEFADLLRWEQKQRGGKGPKTGGKERRNMPHMPEYERSTAQGEGVRVCMCWGVLFGGG